MIIKSGVVLIGKTSFGVNTSGIELNPVGLVQASRSGHDSSVDYTSDGLATIMPVCLDAGRKK